MILGTGAGEKIVIYILLALACRAVSGHTPYADYIRCFNRSLN